jgi:hypothetical protein
MKVLFPIQWQQKQLRLNMKSSSLLGQLEGGPGIAWWEVLVLISEGPALVDLGGGYGVCGSGCGQERHRRGGLDKRRVEDDGQSHGWHAHL